MKNHLPESGVHEQRIQSLDGLRGIAILFVLLYHHCPTLHIFHFGWTGVDLFFVLSGYLISRKLLQSKQTPGYFRNFFFKRALRIWPVYYLVLAVFYIGCLVKGYAHNSDLANFWNNQFFFLSFTQNWAFSFGNFHHNGMLNHLWSIAIEGQFYIFWPLIIYCFSQKTVRNLCVCLILVGAAIRVYTGNFYFNYFNTLTHLDGILIGSIIALTDSRAHRIIKIVGLCALALVCVWIVGTGKFNPNNSIVMNIGYPLVSLAFGGLLLICTDSNGRYKFIHTILRSRFLVYSGRISYGMYIYSWPIYIYLFPRIIAFIQRHGHIKLLFPVIGILFIASIYLIATVSFYFFEKPILDFKNRILSHFRK